MLSTELSTEPSPRPPSGYQALIATHVAAGKSEKRRADRARIHARVVHPIDTPGSIPDPLVHQEESALISAVAMFRLLVAALIIHGIAIVVLAAVSRFVGGNTVSSDSERVSVRIIEEPAPPEEEPPPVEVPEPVEGDIRPDFATEPEVAPPEPPPPVEAPPPPRRQVQPEAADPSPPPAENPAEPAPRRRIVGLSLESTTSGSGPAFSVGTSRMGRTERRAEDPEIAAREPVGTGTGSGSGTGTSGTIQRVAARIPTRDVEFVRPRRLEPSRPPFPATLRAQGIEGNVMVRVQIAPSGSVTGVTIVRSSGHQAFDDTARQAALAERFAPATRDGQPVPFALSYSYRFRIDDQ